MAESAKNWPILTIFPGPGEFDAYRPYRLTWCPIGWLVGGCGTRTVSRKTPILSIVFTPALVNFSKKSLPVTKRVQLGLK